MVWLASARSVRGNSHYASGLPCQDASAVATLSNGQVLIACIADGGGSAALSHIGASIATAITMGALSLLAPRLCLPPEQQPDEEALKAFWRALVEDVRQCIDAEAEQVGTGSQHFGTTLLAVVATHNRLAMMQVGDGFIVYAGRGGPPANGPATEAPDPFHLGFKPDRGEFVGEVTWVTSSSSAFWEVDFGTRVVDGPLDFICLSSDGLEKVAITQRDQTPHSGYFEFIRARLTRQSTAEEAAKLVDDVLLNPDLDKRTDDDKSVVVARWVE